MDIKALLSNNMNPQARLMTETRNLQSKWDKTGLLEGLDGVEKANMSILLESQAKQLLDEATQTGTSANSEQWAGVALPLVRRVFAEIAAKEFVSVQPMNLPSGLVFYLDFKYGTTKDGRVAGVSSLYGGNNKKLGSTDEAVGGLYGPGQFAYSINSTASLLSATLAASSSVATTAAGWAEMGSDSDLSASVAAGKVMKYVINLDENTSAANAGIYNVDLEAVRSFRVSGSGIVSTLGAFAKVINTGSLADQYYQAILYVSASGLPTLATTTLTYSLQPVDSSRGDFEDRTGGNTLDSIGIPEIQLDVKSEPIVAKTRKLKAVWTPEMAQDLNAYHSIDAEAELTGLLSEYVSMEIDLEILDMLLAKAPGATTEAWSAKIGTEFTKQLDANGSAVFTRIEDNASNKTAYVKSTWYQTLGNKIQSVSNKIHKLTLRGGANFLVCSPEVATILESIPGYVVSTDGDSSKFAMGVTKVGSFANRFQVYKNPYMVENQILVGFRGNNFLETGAVYAPYIPLVQTPLVYDPINFTPRRGVLTRYAKKVVRPEFYGKIYIGDLNQV